MGYRKRRNRKVGYMGYMKMGYMKMRYRKMGYRKVGYTNMGYTNMGYTNMGYMKILSEGPLFVVSRGECLLSFCVRL